MTAASTCQFPRCDESRDVGGFCFFHSYKVMQDPLLPLSAHVSAAARKLNAAQVEFDAACQELRAAIEAAAVR